MSRFLRGPQRLYRRWRQRARDNRVLARISDREMRDLGITVADVHRELSRTFWRSTEPLRERHRPAR